MGTIDFRTIIFSLFLTNIVNFGIVALLWGQNKYRFKGIFYWVLNLAFQTLAVLLLVLRGTIPDLISIGLTNLFSLTGSLFGLIGINRFSGRRTRLSIQIPALLLFNAASWYFGLIDPSLEARNLIVSAGLLFFTMQTAWVIIKRYEPMMRRSARTITWANLMFGLISLTRITVLLLKPIHSNDFFASGAFEIGVFIAFQLLLFILTSGYVVLVNRSLTEKIRVSEEKFSKAFHSSPEAVIITRTADGKVVEANDSFYRMTGFSEAEVIGNSTLDLRLWAQKNEREEIVKELAIKKAVQKREYTFRRKNGEPLIGLFSAEMITINGESCIISSIDDISERKQSEDRIEFASRFPDENPAPVMRIDRNGKLLYANEACSRLLPDWNLKQARKVPARIADTARDALEQKITYGLEFEQGQNFFKLFFTPIVEKNYVNVYGHDITAQKLAERVIHMRLELHEYSEAHGLEEVMQKTLDLIEELTNSKIGFYHFIEDDEENILLQAWSTQTEKEFCKAEGKGLHYPISQAGVWVDCIAAREPIIHNDYASLPNKRGMPKGHAQLVRELVVPIIRSKKIVGVLGVGNKESDYNQGDIDTVHYFADIAWEVAERKRLHEAVIKSEERFRTALTDAPLPVMIQSKDGKIEMINKEWVRISGYSHEEIPTVGDWMRAAYGYNDKQVLRHEKQTNEENPRRKDHDHVIKTKKGEARIWRFRSTPLQVSQEHGGMIMHMATDVTASKRSEEALLREQAKVQNYLDTAEVMLLALNADLTISMVNKKGCRILEYKEDELIGRNWLDLCIPKNINDEVKKIFSELIDGKSESAEYYENTIITKSGKERIMGWHNKPLKDENNHIVGVLSSGEDITELKHSEETLKNLLAELKRSNLDLEQFAYVASHDLQEPLRAVSGLTQLLQQRYQGRLDANADEYINLTVAAAQRMQALINGLLDYSRIGRKGNLFQPVDVNETLNSVISNLRQRISETKAVITFDEMPTLDADKIQLIQLFQNLISNGIKFNNSVPPRIHIGCSDERDHWKISVKDNGMGIEPEYHDRIFVLFQRLHTQREIVGTGIGLPICKKIVERHGGSIWVESTPGEGSIIYFTMLKRR